MQHVNAQVRALVDDLCPVRTQIRIDGSAIDADILRLSYSAAIGSGAFTIGEACAASAIVTIGGIHADLDGKSASVIWQASGTSDWYPLISGTVDTSDTTVGVTTIKILDAIYTAGGNEYLPSDSVLTACALSDALADVAAQLGIPLDNVTAAAAAAVQLPEGVGNLAAGTTISGAAGALASLAGGTAIVSREGALRITLPQASGAVYDAYAGQDQTATSAYSIAGIDFRRTNHIDVQAPDGSTQRVEQVIDFQAGSAPFLLKMNNLASQADADRVYDSLKDFTFYGGSLGCPGGLLAEPGDIADVRTASGSKRILVSGIVLHIDGGCRATITSAGMPVWKQPAQGSINKRIQDMAERVYQLQTTAAGLIAEAANIRGEMTQIIQTAEEIAITAANREVSTFMRVTTEGVNIGRNESISELLLTDDGVKSLLAGADVATIGTEGVQAELVSPDILHFSGTGVGAAHFFLAVRGGQLCIY